MRVILASASPRRKELLAQLGVAFEVIPSNGEEIITKIKPEEVVQELAQQKAKELVAEEAIYQEARRQCQEMFVKTQERISDLRKASNDYMDDALRRTEEAISLSLNEVRDTRAKFRALAESQENRNTETAETEAE